MQQGGLAGCLALGVAALLLAPLCQAASFLTSSHAVSNLSADHARMPTVVHSKEPGGDYQEGSPLYDKQEDWLARWFGWLSPAPKPPVPSTVHHDKNAAPEAAAVEASSEGSSVGDSLNLKRHGWFDFNPMRHLGTYLTWGLLVIFAAIIYSLCLGRSLPSPQRTILPGERDFTYSIFSCENCFGSHLKVCLCAWCCTPIRWADTMSKEPTPRFINFWVGLLIFLLLVGFAEIASGLLYFLPVLLGCFFRQKLRTNFGMEKGNVRTIAEDCCVWCFCWPCAAAQEARQVEFVMLQPPALRPGEKLATGTLITGTGSPRMAMRGTGSPRMAMTSPKIITASPGSQVRTLPGSQRQ